MKITLVSPPSTIEERYPKGHPLRKAIQVVEPLGLAYIAAVLEQNHFEVEILDCIAEELTVSDLVQRIKHSNPSVVGISAVTPNIHVALKLANEIKRVLPDITIVLGGVHPTLFPQQILKNGGVDIVVIGEGEYTMLELSETLDRGRELSDVLGIAYRKDGKITICPPRPLENDLDNLPFPARYLLPMHSYKPFIHKRYPAHALMSSRGCPFQCVFCCRDISGRHHRLRSVGNVIEEIKVLTEEYNTKEVDFQEPIFCLNKKWTENFCQKLIEENLDIVWSAQTRVDMVDETLLRLMKKSGCWMLYYGIEAGDQLLLDNMKKNVELSQIRKSVELTSKVGIKAWGSFMFGLPGENPDLAHKTLNFAKSLPLDFASFHLTTPFPGTELWYKSNEWGEIKTNFSKFTQLNAVFIPSGWKGRESDLQNMIGVAFKEFYFRPSYVLRQILKIRSISDLRFYLRGLRGLI